MPSHTMLVLYVMLYIFAMFRATIWVKKNEERKRLKLNYNGKPKLFAMIPFVDKFSSGNGDGWSKDKWKASKLCYHFELALVTTEISSMVDIYLLCRLHFKKISISEITTQKIESANKNFVI
jgi:hypothetical protein